MSLEAYGKQRALAYLGIQMRGLLLGLYTTNFKEEEIKNDLHNILKQMEHRTFTLESEKPTINKSGGTWHRMHEVINVV